jgi:hypothetical protein
MQLDYGSVNLLYNSSLQISLKLGSSCHGNRYGTEKTGGTIRPSRKELHLPGHFPPASQTGCREGPVL